MALAPGSILTIFVLFCRVGCCLMLMPGFSSSHIPSRVRLFLAFSLTLTLTPVLAEKIPQSLSEDSPAALIRLFASESVIGALIGFLGRIFFGALETMTGFISMAIGLTSPLGGSAEGNEFLPPVATLAAIAAAALVFITDLHWEVLRGLAASYSAIPVQGIFDPRFDLVQAADWLAKSFLLSMQISSPFIVYTLIINFAIALATKLVPQIPFYFITLPAVLAGGLLLLYATCLPFFENFNEAFSQWLLRG